MNCSLDRQKIKQIIFFVSLSLFIFWGSISSSTYIYVLPNSLFNLILGASLLGFLIKIIFFERYTYYEIILIPLLLFIALLVYKNLGLNIVVMYTIAIIACRGIDIYKIICTYFYVSLFVLLILIISAKFSIIVNIVNFKDSVPRYAWGTLYSTNLSSRVFFLILSYVYLNKFILRFRDTLFIFLIAAISYQQTLGRLDSFSIIMILFIALMFKYNLKKIIKILSHIAIFSPIIGFIVSYFFSAHYTPFSKVYSVLNEIFSNRLSLGNQALNIYDISKPFGQMTYSRGMGGVYAINGTVDKYFYIDSSYLLIALRYGIVFSVFLFILLVIKLNQSFKEKNYVLLLSFSLVCINAIVADFLYVPYINPFILVLFAKVSDSSYSRDFIFKGSMENINL